MNSDRLLRRGWAPTRTILDLLYRYPRPFLWLGFVLLVPVFLVLGFFGSVVVVVGSIYGLFKLRRIYKRMEKRRREEVIEVEYRVLEDGE